MIEGELVVHDIDLEASPEDVFAMFVDPQRLVRWLGLTADLEPRPGGLFRFEVVPGQFCEGRYVLVEPPNRLIFTWGWSDPAMGVAPGSSQVEVNIRKADEGARLRLVHSGLATSEGRLLHEDGWSRFLDRLAGALRGDETTPYPSDSPQERLAALQQVKGEPWQ
jgi:uncharacterized protein YndB with AHSA1/START domain